MGSSAVQVTNLSDLNDPLGSITEAINAMNCSFEAARMEIGQGISTLAAEFGECCDAYVAMRQSEVDAKYVTPSDAMYDVVVNQTTTTTNPDGTTTTTVTPTTQTVTISGPGATGLQTATDAANWASYIAALNLQTQQNFDTQAGWQAQWQAYIEDQQDYRDATSLLYFLQILADLVILSEMLSIRRDMFEKADGALDSLIALQGPATEGATAALGLLDTHLSDTATKASAELATACESMNNMATRAEALQMLWEDLGYSGSQTAHTANIATDLAQMIDSGNVAAEDLMAQCQALDDVWSAGGGWTLLEDKLTAQGDGTFQGALCEAAGKAGDLATYLEECGQGLANIFATQGGGGNYAATISPAMIGLISDINAGGATLQALKDSIAQAQTCVTDYKARYEAVYGAAEDAHSNGILASGAALINNPAVFTDCFQFLQELALTAKTGWETYNGTELGLATAIHNQATAIATTGNHQLAIDFISAYKDDCLAIYSSVYEGGESALQMALLQLATDMAACVTAAHTFLETHRDEMDACWQAGYSGEKGWASALLTQATGLLSKHEEIIGWLCDNAIEIKAQYDSTYLPGENMLASGTYAAASALVTEFVNEHGFFDQKAMDHYNCWLADYKPNERLLGQNVFDAANTLVADMVANNDWFDDKAQQEFNCWMNDYQPSEKNTLSINTSNITAIGGELPGMYNWFKDKGVALEDCYQNDYVAAEKDILAVNRANSNAIGPNLTDMYSWFKNKGILMENCYQDDYRPREKLAMAEIMDEGTMLADCVSLTHEWMCAQSDKTYQHWCQHWVPKEEAYVCAVFDRTEDLVEESYQCITDWCTYIDTKLDFWVSCYEQAECDNLPKLINEITPACLKHTEQYNEVCLRSQKQYDGWCDNWAQCDIDDLLRHCAITDKVLPLEEICDDNACQQNIGTTLKDCYLQLGLTCEKAYIQEICDLTKYEPRYCEVQDRAVAHVREQYGVTEEKLRKTSGKFCSGSLLQSLTQLEGERNRIEAAALQAADRWEWWREMQECDRRHRYKIDMIAAIERWPTNAMQALQLSTQGNDLILGRINERISRGYQWLAASQNNSQQTFQALQTAQQLGISATEQGHFWQNWWSQNKNAYASQTATRINQGNDMIRIGQQNNAQAFQSKQAAVNAALGAMDRTLQSIGQGHNLAQLASQDKERALRTVESAINFSLQSADDGHVVSGQATQDKNIALRTIEDAINFALQSVDDGHNINAQASNSRQLAEAIVEAAIRQGQTAVDDGHVQAQLATADENAAHAVSRDAVDRGQTTVQFGHAKQQRAIDTRVQSAARTEAVTDDALQTVGQGHFYHRQASSDAQAALQAALSAIDDGHNAVNQGLNHKARALDAANSEGSQANNAANTGLAATDRGHNLHRLALEGKNSAISELQQTWSNFVSHLQHGMGHLQQALNFQQVSDTALRDLIARGTEAAGIELSVFNAAQRKVDGARQLAQASADDLINAYQVAVSRLNSQLGAKNSLIGQGNTAASQFTGLMSMGNDFQKGSNNMLSAEAELRKRCAQQLCDTLINGSLNYTRAATQASSSIFGLAYAAADDATNRAIDSTSGVFAGLQGIVGPAPVFNPVGFNTQQNGFFNSGIGNANPAGLDFTNNLISAGAG